MENIKEQDLLRLAMILENQSSTTRDKYICKFAEYVVFDSDKPDLSVSEICTAIKEKFQLEFDLSEIEKAIRYKGDGRIINISQRYQLSPKAADQISKLPSMADQLKEYICVYSETIGNIDAAELYLLVIKYIYYCFNSNANNFLKMIGTDSRFTFSADENGSVYSQDEAELINGFLRWENIDKNRLVYSIVASSYEYCLITSNKNPAIPRSIFKNKKFFLDTNIIFRIAGFNKDERRFVTKTFVEKCREVGVSLCYTGAVLDEIHRVIDAQINYIRAITKDQSPINPDVLSKLNNEYATNDFYLMYYNWCKERQNSFRDYSAFRSYLIKRIDSVIYDLEYHDSSTIPLSSKPWKELFDSLYAYKRENRKNRLITEESIKTDITQILFLKKARPTSAKSLWDMNEFIVSADQLLVSWAESQFEGVPIVVIPSVWLAIILKISGRATEDDYQSFCAFMTLRHYCAEDSNIAIDPSELLLGLSNKTIDSRLKEAIISEIITNKSEYSFDSSDAYDVAIEKAFDVVLKNYNDIHKEDLIKAVDAERQKAQIASQEYESELANKKTAKEYAQEYARLKAQKKVNCFANRRHVPLIVKGVAFAVLAFLVVCFIVKIQPFYNWFNWIVASEHISDRIWSILTWIINIVFITLPIYFGKVWEYLSSEQRENRLCAKYFKQQLKVLNDKSLTL